MKMFEVYIDESGNTGLDLFKDANQPFFWTGSIVLDGSVKYPYEVQELAESVGMLELHGSELGIGRIDRLAMKIIEIIEHVDARFHFTRIEKKHISTMRFVDAILDNVNNASVNPLHYQISMMRKIIAAKIDMFFDDQDKIDFWNIHLSGNPGDFKSFLRKFRQKISYRYPSSDRTGKFRILDALEWGIRHPEELLTERVTKTEGVRDYRSLEYESPNLVSVMIFLSGLHNLAVEHGRKISKVVHDEQSQFGKYLQESYRFLRRINIQDPYDLFQIAEETDIFPEELEISSSASSPHLQVIDVCMWLLKQKLDSEKDIHGFAGKLLDVIVERSSIFHFSSEFLRIEAEFFTRKIMSIPLSEEELARGKYEFLKLEAARQLRLNQNW